MLLDKGRICLKIAGREAGKYCVVISPAEEGFIIINGPKSITRVKKRKCNITHLEPTEHKFDIQTGEDNELENLWKSSDLIKKLNIQIPVKRNVEKKSA